MNTSNTPSDSPLGKAADYQTQYDPSLLYPMPRAPKRAELMARAEAIQARWPLPATKWLRVFKPLKDL